MAALRALVGTVLLLLVGGTSAEEFWGRKLPGQPTEFIFGYGSLINSESRNATAGRPILAIPVRVSAAFGYVRSWTIRSQSGFTALGLRKLGPGEDGTTINGVLYPVQGNDIDAYDAREEGYVRVRVPLDQIEALSWLRLPEQGNVWAYVPVRAGQEPGAELLPPNSEFPVLQSYLDVVLEGGLEYGTEFAQEIVATTKDWSKYWLNDRQMARRPWVFDKRAAAVDKLLTSVPQFADRMFAEPYAVKNLPSK